MTRVGTVGKGLWRGKGRGWLLGVGVVALGGLAAWSSGAASRGREALQVELFLAETAGFGVPLPEDVPAVEAGLVARATEIAERFAPGEEALVKAAQLRSLETLRQSQLASLLALDSVVGAGILRNDADTAWELVVLVPEGSSLMGAQQDLEALALEEALQGFGYRLVQVSAPRLTGPQRPGLTRIWRSPLQDPNVCDVATMGWLAKSKVEDEVNWQGAPTGRTSIGYLTVLHGTAAGPTHIWEDFGVVNREVAWANNTSCSASASGRSPRLGPSAPGTDLGDISQDIDYVALEFKAACDHSEQYFQVGIPSCPNFASKISPFDLVNDPISTTEQNPLYGTRAQICGAETQDVREGTLEGIHFTLQIPVVDYSGNPVLGPGGQVILTLDNLWLITNGLSDPDFAQPGDSGAPVWALDATAAGSGGATVWRPLGVQSAISTDLGSGDKLSFITPLLPDNLPALEAEIIFDNPYNIDMEPCDGSCDNCSCEPARVGL
ncbi:MAG: hypothetical protein KDD47_18415, partial [Acidobacteria bacterium]|nr:hypothetical protein [Acidobacteriota bacterium]